MSERDRLAQQRYGKNYGELTVAQQFIVDDDVESQAGAPQQRQAFNPATGQQEWQQYNSATGQWEFTGVVASRPPSTNVTVQNEPVSSQGAFSRKEMDDLVTEGGGTWNKAHTTATFDDGTVLQFDPIRNRSGEVRFNMIDKTPSTKDSKTAAPSRFQSLVDQYKTATGGSSAGSPAKPSQAGTGSGSAGDDSFLKLPSGFSTPRRAGTTPGQYRQLSDFETEDILSSQARQFDPILRASAVKPAGTSADIADAAQAQALRAHYQDLVATQNPTMSSDEVARTVQSRYFDIPWAERGGNPATGADPALYMGNPTAPMTSTSLRSRATGQNVLVPSSQMDNLFESQSQPFFTGYAGGGHMTLDEPVIGVGVRSGKPRFVAGEKGAGSEDIYFVPRRRRFAEGGSASFNSATRQWEETANAPAMTQGQAENRSVAEPYNAYASDPTLVMAGGGGGGAAAPMRERNSRQEAWEPGVSTTPSFTKLGDSLGAAPPPASTYQPELGKPMYEGYDPSTAPYERANPEVSWRWPSGEDFFPTIWERLMRPLANWGGRPIPPPNFSGMPAPSYPAPSYPAPPQLGTMPGFTNPPMSGIPRGEYPVRAQGNSNPVNDLLDPRARRALMALVGA
jgi:hypothetical protein